MSVAVGTHSYQRLLDQEANAVPAALRELGEPVPPTRPVPVERYLAREFHELEKRLLWPRVWQAVCRESEVANPGDWFAWEIAGVPLFVQRDAHGGLRAFRNACLHRGRQLRGAASPCRGTAGEIRCPFHGFRWTLDGAFAGAPCQEDFPQIDATAFSLPRLALGTWGGWVFVNLDRDAPPLADYLGVIPRHFAPWRPEQTRKSLHIRKVLRCNWKLAHEAFIESFHTIATHPQLLPYTGDVQSQHDAFGATVSRTMTPMGVASPHLALEDEAQTVEGWMQEQGGADALPGRQRAAARLRADLRRCGSAARGHARHPAGPCAGVRPGFRQPAAGAARAGGAGALPGRFRHRCDRAHRGGRSFLPRRRYHATRRAHHADAARDQAAHMLLTRPSEDHAEAIRAYEEGREPVFRGQ